MSAGLSWTFYRPLPHPSISLRTATAHLPSFRSAPLLSRHTTLRLHLHTICLLVYLLPFSHECQPKQVGAESTCSLLHLQLLEQCLTQNKCSINTPVRFLNERTKVTFPYIKVVFTKISANAPGVSFPSFLPRLMLH